MIGELGLEHINWYVILEVNIKPQFLELNKKELKTDMEAVA